MQRSVAGQAAFLEEADYEFMLNELRSLSRRHEVAIHAYALMPDQFHLLVTPSNARSLSLAMQALGRRYVRDFNRRHGRSGTLWQARFRCTVIDPSRFFLPCSLFVELGPVRAQHVSDPSVYSWSSLGHHVGIRNDSAIADHAEVWKLGNTPFERQDEYRRLAQAGLAEPDIARIHNAVEHGWALGDAAFLKELGTKTERRLAPLPVGRPRRERTASSGKSSSDPSDDTRKALEG